MGQIGEILLTHLARMWVIFFAEKESRIAQCCATRWRTMNNGWILVGYWLDIGWILVWPCFLDFPLHDSKFSKKRFKARSRSGMSWPSSWWTAPASSLGSMAWIPSVGRGERGKMKDTSRLPNKVFPWGFSMRWLRYRVGPGRYSGETWMKDDERDWPATNTSKEAKNACAETVSRGLVACF